MLRVKSISNGRKGMIEGKGEVNSSGRKSVIEDKVEANSSGRKSVVEGKEFQQQKKLGRG